MHNFGNLDMGYGFAGGFPLWFATFIPLFIFWSLFWKSLALWHSAQRGQYWWFIILLVVNSIGILEIIYLFAVLKMRAAELFSSKQ